MTRLTKNDRKSVFRSNLQAFMKQTKFDSNSLAARMGLDRDGRKWLGRLLSDGLDRTNSKSEPKLQQLCECIGLKSTKQLWDASLTLTVCDDYHINTVERLLKQGGSPADHLRSIIEWTACAVEKAEKFSAAHGESMNPDQKLKAIDHLFEHIRDSPDNSLADLERTTDGFEVAKDDWPNDAAQFIERFQKLHPLRWQRFKKETEKHNKESGSDFSVIADAQFFIEEDGPIGFYRWLLSS